MDENGGWNKRLIEEFFHSGDVAAILKFPLQNLGKSDSFIWHFDSKGTFSVKSAYKLICLQRVLRRDNKPECSSEGEGRFVNGRLWKVGGLKFKLSAVVGCCCK
ncbi:Calcium/calmodulin-dependent 3',5'-cyclic nucleotide phosphodiesterase 1B [Striga asiatica]|uniref:Calcium/calmodulin-dependent 3',5'-cyclic nucleotide phosphodiesterase 1B n=1 Tax=Striga asiatica TaxID=4170 RepID=A0A5A7QYF5_STRAF|nr:Calcium/calmodulin-dependent 3',5'-cyclic nucleotide phosphodiesterase 1B [Striga asiatica]